MRNPSRTDRLPPATLKMPFHFERSRLDVLKDGICKNKLSRPSMGITTSSLLYATQIPTLFDLCLYTVSRNSGFKESGRELLNKHFSQSEPVKKSVLFDLGRLKTLCIIKMCFTIRHTDIVKVDPTFEFKRTSQQESRSFEMPSHSSFGRIPLVVTEHIESYKNFIEDSVGITIFSPIPMSSTSFKKATRLILPNGLLWQHFLKRLNITPEYPSLPSRLSIECIVYISHNSAIGMRRKCMSNLCPTYKFDRKVQNLLKLHGELKKIARSCKHALHVQRTRTKELLVHLVTRQQPSDSDNSHLFSKATHCSCFQCSFFRDFIK